MEGPLRWLFFGCGAVGGYFGARLAEKGEKVSFMVRKDTLRVLNSEGVKVKSICGDVHIPRAKLDQVMNTEALDKESRWEADVIVLACKAWEVERCLQMCAPWCGKTTLVLPLQNGVDGAGKVRQMVSGWGRGHPLVGWCNIVAAIQEPGLIKHWAAHPPAVYFGEFEGEATAKTKALESIFSKCQGVAVHLEQDALCACWEKFSFICSTTAVQATAGPSATQDLIPKVPELEQMWRSAMREIMAVARAHGVNYKEEWIDKRLPILADAVGATTSCSRDLWAGRHSELDDLLGSVHRLGEAKNVATPVISTCYRSLSVRDRVARREATLPIYPLLEGQKILGTICNHKGQQLPAERTLVQKKAEEFLRPEWFICPMTSAVPSGGQSEIPEGVQMMWEAELGVVISHACENLSVEEAMNYVGGYCVVLDLTGGNLGFETMKHGMSWTRNKCQSSFKPVCGTSYEGDAGNAAHKKFRIHEAYTIVRQRMDELKPRVEEWEKAQKEKLGDTAEKKEEKKSERRKDRENGKHEEKSRARDKERSRRKESRSRSRHRNNRREKSDRRRHQSRSPSRRRSRGRRRH